MGMMEKQLESINNKVSYAYWFLAGNMGIDHKRIT